MTCAEVELLLCDHVDGTLKAAECAAVEEHLSMCTACAMIEKDSAAVLRFLERVPAVEPPPALVTRILQQPPPGEPLTAKTTSAIGKLLGGWLEPILQPRLVMGMAMTILSFAMLGRFAGIEARQMRAADLDPVKVWEAAEDRVHRTWLKTVKYYESLRFVYEIQSRLHELTESEEEATPQLAPKPSSPGAEQTGGTPK